MHSLELNVSLTSLWLTEFNQRNNATLGDLKKRLTKARDEAGALGEKVRALEEAAVASELRLRTLGTEAHALDAQFSLLVATIERQSALHSRDLERVRAGARSELAWALLCACVVLAIVRVCPGRRWVGAGGASVRQGGVYAGALGSASEPLLPTVVGGAGTPSPPLSAMPVELTAGGLWRSGTGGVPRSYTFDSLREPNANGHARPHVARLGSQPPFDKAPDGVGVGYAEELSPLADKAR
ncbi:hypothetical protein T492DRAFT_1021555 [Pavlovales sp. CCMP2436]|nr:hypothetical protein T492DRAFT_1021555 [Pavlovales sp. CCMP2436]